MRIPVLVVALLAATAFAGCTAPGDDSSDADDNPGSASGGSGGSSSSADSAAPAYGSVSLYIKDAPEHNFSEVHVVVESVEVHLAGVSDNATDSDGDDVPDEADPSPGNETDDGNQTADGNETAEGNSTSDGNVTQDGNVTADGNTTSDGNVTAPDGNATADGNETLPDGNETAPDGNQTSDGNETADGNQTADPAPAAPPVDAASLDCKAGWVTLWNGSADIDLLATQGDLAAFLGEASLPACKVTQIRLHVSSAYGVQGNDTVPIELANGVLRVVRSFDVVPGAEQRIVVDVDLSKSLHQTGPQGGPKAGSGSWRMTPVIGKTMVDIVDDDESGAESADTGDIQSV